jgi:hypothetical protein
MSHELIALIIKAQNENKARQKAEDVRDNLCACGVKTWWGSTYDWGVVINGEFRFTSDPSGWSFTNRWIPKEKTHPLYERLNSSRRILRLDSENAQEFIDSRYECPSSTDAEDVKLYKKFDLAGLVKKGYYVRDEQGQYILQNDSRLHERGYFIVPLDMHS